MLAFPDQLMDVGIAFVPHGQKQSVYSALLDGKPLTPPKPKPPMLADDHALPKAPRLETLYEPRAIADIDVELGDPDDDDVDMPHEQMTLEEYLSFYICQHRQGHRRLQHRRMVCLRHRMMVWLLPHRNKAYLSLPALVDLRLHGHKCKVSLGGLSGCSARESLEMMAF